MPSKKKKAVVTAKKPLAAPKVSQKEFTPSDNPLEIKVKNPNGTWSLVGSVLVVGNASVTFNGYTYKPNRSYWWWATNPWTATNGFALFATSGTLSANNTPTSANDVYTNGVFSGDSSTFNGKTVNFSIQVGATIKGYAHRTANSINFYLLGTGTPPPYYPVPASGLAFLPNSQTVSFTGWGYTDQETNP